MNHTPINIIWLGQGGFLLECNNFRLLIDPYISDCIQKLEGFRRLHPFPLPLADLKVDLLLTTHDHLDHFDPEGIPLVRKMYPACRYAGPERSFNHFLQLGIPEDMVIGIKPDKEYSFGSFKVTPIPALHSDPTACGYCIEGKNRKIVLTGDTRYDESLLVPIIKNADLLLICINGKLNNMDSNEALRYVQKSTPQTALPMHIGLFAENTADPQPFIEKCLAINVKSFAMTPGKEFAI